MPNPNNILGLQGVNEEWLIQLAREGDGKYLAEWLLTEPVSLRVLAFLADVVSGKIRLKRPKKLTYEVRRLSYVPEKMVVRLVEIKMREAGHIYGTKTSALTSFGNGPKSTALLR